MAVRCAPLQACGSMPPSLLFFQARACQMQLVRAKFMRLQLMLLLPHETSRVVRARISLRRGRELACRLLTTPCAQTSMSFDASRAAAVQHSHALASLQLPAVVRLAYGGLLRLLKEQPAIVAELLQAEHVGARNDAARARSSTPRPEQEEGKAQAPSDGAQPAPALRRDDIRVVSRIVLHGLFAAATSPTGRAPHSSVAPAQPGAHCWRNDATEAALPGCSALPPRAVRSLEELAQSPAAVQLPSEDADMLELVRHLLCAEIAASRGMDVDPPLRSERTGTRLLAAYLASPVAVSALQRVVWPALQRVVEATRRGIRVCLDARLLQREVEAEALLVPSKASSQPAALPLGTRVAGSGEVVETELEAEAKAETLGASASSTGDAAPAVEARVQAERAARLKHLQEVCTEFVCTITAAEAVQDLPHGLRYLCRHLVQALDAKFPLLPGDDTSPLPEHVYPSNAFPVVCSVLFTRWIFPNLAIASGTGQGPLALLDSHFQPLPAAEARSVAREAHVPMLSSRAPPLTVTEFKERLSENMSFLCKFLAVVVSGAPPRPGWAGLPPDMLSSLSRTAAQLAMRVSGWLMRLSDVGDDIRAWARQAIMSNRTACELAWRRSACEVPSATVTLDDLLHLRRVLAAAFPPPYAAAPDGTVSRPPATAASSQLLPAPSSDSELPGLPVTEHELLSTSSAGWRKILRAKEVQASLADGLAAAAVSHESISATAASSAAAAALSLSDVRAAKRVFEQADLNGDGRLDAMELSKVCAPRCQACCVPCRLRDNKGRPAYRHWHAWEPWQAPRTCWPTCVLWTAIPMEVRGSPLHGRNSVHARLNANATRVAAVEFHQFLSILHFMKTGMTQQVCSRLRGLVVPTHAHPRHCQARKVPALALHKLHAVLDVLDAVHPERQSEAAGARQGPSLVLGKGLCVDCAPSRIRCSLHPPTCSGHAIQCNRGGAAAAARVWARSCA